MKYRVIQEDSWFKIQIKSGLFWWTINDSYTGLTRWFIKLEDVFEYIEAHKKEQRKKHKAFIVHEE